MSETTPCSDLWPVAIRYPLGVDLVLAGATQLLGFELSLYFSWDLPCGIGRDEEFVADRALVGIPRRLALLDKHFLGGRLHRWIQLGILLRPDDLKGGLRGPPLMLTQEEIRAM